MKLTTTVHQYPNPAYRWCIVYLDGLEIGRCDVRTDGYVLRGRRKVHPLDEAARLMLRAAITDARKRRTEAAADEARATLQLRGLKVKARSKTPNDGSKAPRSGRLG